MDGGKKKKKALAELVVYHLAELLMLCRKSFQ